MTSAPQWGRLPEGLRNAEQWCVAAPDKSPYSTSGFRASVINPSHWTDWTSACMVAQDWGAGAGIGFVLTEDDEFTCIDLDVKDSTPPEELARYQRIIEAFDSYTEHSASGRGYHIWIKGAVGPGARRDGVEVYSQQRFIICTGNVVLDRPVERRQEMLDILVAEIRSGQAGASGSIELVEIAPELTDEELWNKAISAENGAKFSDLWHGRWQGNGYPSQSEADLSLLSMLTFYSKSNEQCRRMFRMSELGKRDKATKNDKYIDRTLGLIRARQAREDKVMAQMEQNAIQLTAAAIKGPAVPLLPVVAPPVMEWPPGPIGAVAQWLYSVAPRPVREVAIVSALGMFAGIFGRAFNISNTGLNLYIVLVARSAVGKEAIHSGLSKLSLHLMNGAAPEMGDVLDFSDYASGPALVKAISQRPSFCNIAGEWGRKLRMMSDDHVVGPMSTLRTVMTNLYQKSAAGTIVGGIGYSDKEKDVKSMDGVAYSMIGETTPDTFYESLTNTMMQDGFMSRFITIEYAGLRPELNKDQNTPPPEWLGSYMRNAFDQITRLPGGMFYDVVQGPEAAQLLEEFNLRCDREINSTDDETWRQMWNRAHLKALKLAGLLAVAECFATPVVQRAHAEWALDVVQRDIRIMSRKVHEGDIGDSDMSRQKKLLSVIFKYTQEPISPGYKLPDEMRVAGVVARKYLQNKVQRVNSFLKHKLGQTIALDSTIKNLMDSGYLVEVARDKIPAHWGSVGRCYRILTLPDVQ